MSVPTKPESRCTCSHDSTHLCTNEMCDVGSHNRHHCHSQNCTAILRCPHCLNQDAEIQRLSVIAQKWERYANDVTDAKNAEIQWLTVESIEVIERIDTWEHDLDAIENGLPVNGDPHQTVKVVLASIRGYLKHRQPSVWSIHNKQAKEIQWLKEDVAMNDDFVAALEAKVKSLAPHETCACDYDKPGDVCAHHSPTVQRLTQELAARDVTLSTTGNIIGDQHNKITRLTEALTVAVEALATAKRLIVHHANCAAMRSTRKCDCGFMAVKQAIAALEVKK